MVRSVWGRLEGRKYKRNDVIIFNSEFFLKKDGILKEISKQSTKNMAENRG